jgi:hypothetical protein
VTADPKAQALGAIGGAGAIVAALHLPDLRGPQGRSMAFLEDYVVANARVFAQAGVPAIMIQDQTREPGPATPGTIAVVSALGRLVREAFPGLRLGIIVQAHDAEAPLAIAHGCGASFVRLTVFVAASMTMEGPKTGLGVAAAAARHALGREDIAILADVFDRTSLPMVDVSPEQGALWAERLGADGLVLTGDSFRDSLERIARARAAGVRRPLLIGGGVTQENVGEALAAADGAIVSTSLMRAGAGPADVLRWDLDKTRRFMDAVRAGEARHG